MNSILTTNKLDAIIKNQFQTLADANSIKLFMLNYFKNYVVITGKPNNYSLKQCIDNVNKLLAEPVAKLVSNESISKSDRERINVWNEAQQAFEKEILIELIKLGSNFESPESLYDYLRNST